MVNTARRRQKLSYGELATRSRTDKAWLHRLENGEHAEPDTVLLTRVAEVLHIDPVRIDRLSRNRLATSLPSMRTYLRTKEHLSPEALDEIESAVAAIRAKHSRRESQGGRSDAGSSGGRP
jgi:transcriptional regulator with XRE-family HTH domain